jgi:hypothetical protein
LFVSFRRLMKIYSIVFLISLLLISNHLISQPFDLSLIFCRKLSLIFFQYIFIFLNLLSFSYQSHLLFLWLRFFSCLWIPKFIKNLIFQSLPSSWLIIFCKVWCNGRCVYYIIFIIIVDLMIRFFIPSKSIWTVQNFDKVWTSNFFLSI